MRILKECYEIVLKQFIKQRKFKQGICSTIANCFTLGSLTYDEYLLVKYDFLARKPINGGFFFNKKNEINLSLDFHYDYWWSLNWFGYRKRIKFLRKIIKSL